MANKVVFSNNDIYNYVEIANEFLKNYNLVANHVYIQYIRLLSKGKKLHFILNNLDMKLIFTKDLEVDIEIDKLYNISELYNIFKGMKVYPYFEFDFDSNIIEFAKDAIFEISTIEIDDRIKNEIFNLKEVQGSSGEDLVINDSLLQDVKNIKTIFSLKNKDSNYYFYNDDKLFFNFKNVYIKKSLFKFKIYTDIISFRFISYIFEKFNNITLHTYKSDNNFMFKSDNIYIEGKSLNYFDDKQEYLVSQFNSYKMANNLFLKLEFFNFISTISYYDKKACVIFDDNQIRIQSNIDDFNCNFYIEDFEGFFIINIITLQKILKLLMSYNSKCVDSFEFEVGTSLGCKWVRVKRDDIELITEVFADVNEVKEDEEVEEDESFNSFYEEATTEEEDNN